MTRAAFLAGVSVGILVCLWWIARSIATPERPAWVHDEDALPPFDPRQWQHRMERT